MHQSNDSVEEKILTDFVSSVTSSALLKVEEKLGYGFVKLKVAEAERRQAFHDIRCVEDVTRELVRNSRDAGAKNIFVGFQKEKGRYRRITVLDDGCGIPHEMHSLVFEPRVTSRCENFEEDIYGVHGRGMALFSIKSRVEDMRLIMSEPGVGTLMSVMIDTNKLSERSDQASMPLLNRTTDGFELGPGPHNVQRLLLEICLDSKDTGYYLGSFAEVLSTIYSMSKKKQESLTGGIWSEIAVVDDAKYLSEFAGKRLGLPVSDRNSYRILNDEIPPLESVFLQAESAAIESNNDLTGEKRIEIDKEEIDSGIEKNRLKLLKKNELEEIGEGVKAATGQVIEKYYLKVSGSPKVKKGRGKITISLFISENDH